MKPGMKHEKMTYLKKLISTDLLTNFYRHNTLHYYIMLTNYYYYFSMYEIE